jgi:polysaccharide pyruvyl transferase WcaK-like protein
MRVSVHGSYFGYNFGDTLLCKLFVDWIRECGEHQIVLPLANERNVRLIGGDRRGLAAALGSDRAIFCGGGSFSESPSRKRLWTLRVFTRHLWLGRLLRARRIPVAIMGVGVGPISNAHVRRSVVELFEYAQIAIVRDEESAAHLREWGLRRDVIVGSDAVLAADLRSVFQLGDRVTQGERRLVVHGSGNASLDELSAVRSVCTWASGKQLDVILATDGVSRRGAIQWPSAIAAEFPLLQAETFLYDGRPANLIRFLAGADGIVTTKLHVGIAGSILGVPVISAPVHPKTIRFYRQLGHTERVVGVSEHSAGERLHGLLQSWHDGNLPAPTALPRYDYRAAVAHFLLSHQ